MRLVVIILAISLLSACDRRDGGGDQPAANPSPAPSREAAQTSIIRPDIAPPSVQPPPIEPLSVIVAFPDGGATIPDEGLEKLKALLGSQQVQQGGPIKLSAHSDSAGTDAINLSVSRKRGDAVRAWLVEHGIPETRIALIVFGEQNPLKPNALPDGTPNEAGRAANRRVEIQVPVSSVPSAQQREPTLAEEIVEQTGPDAKPAGQGDNSD